MLSSVLAFSQKAKVESRYSATCDETVRNELFRLHKFILQSQGRSSRK